MRRGEKAWLLELADELSMASSLLPEKSLERELVGHLYGAIRELVYHGPPRFVRGAGRGQNGRERLSKARELRGRIRESTEAAPVPGDSVPVAPGNQ